ncbi:lipoyl(octanoyl) transferase LipB [Alicyclobacillus kakegawensis]|uniref:lipoyl(octanoyl) transferase LipB n=1 Tax=Alicyclobacillus kakegawensis TaxID=392012 RepID=UPI000AACE224|nr:lipoyl(octanoyl) transferase LipB [Alicyclobacillus kakegawensis]
MSRVRGIWRSLGRMDYDAALAEQMARRDAVLHGHDEAQTVYAVEHPPTITIGKAGTFEHILTPPAALEQMGFTIREVDRGGDVTYHGPGQWVLYPVLHLAPWGNDVGRYVRMLEETVIRALAELDIQGTRSEGYPGVWVQDRKICAVGASVKRRLNGEFVTAHGLALNVTTNLAHFNAIVPCGISDRGVTSVAAELGSEVPFAEWEDRLRTSFADVFEMDF